jgi:PAS domain S-box-containing protein
MAEKFPIPSNKLFPKVADSLFIDALFSSIGDGAIATDEFSRIVRVNSIALDILGYKQREVLGKWFPSKVVAVSESGEKVNPMERSITKSFITGKPITESTYYLHKNGHKIPVSITVSPILLNGRPIGAINLFRDITQEYEIDKMKSEFISLASHQLRTPLSAIKTYSHMLIDGLMGKLNADQKFALSAVVEASDRMNQLTDTLLNITRIESGSVTISKREVDIAELAKKVIKEQSLEAGGKNLTVRLHSPSKPTIVNTDRFITKEILTNLLSNAIKYTPQNGKVTITIKPRGEEVICCVADSGIGIPKQSYEQIFDKFFRASNVLERDTTGTGLGLYLIKSLADHIDIPVWFDSEVDKGSTFCFSLPAVATKVGKIPKKPKKKIEK